MSHYIYCKLHTYQLSSSFVLFSSDGGDGDWRRHRHSPHRHPNLLHLAEDPASKSVVAEIVMKNENLHLSVACSHFNF